MEGSYQKELNLGFKWQFSSAIYISILQLIVLVLLGRLLEFKELGIFTIFQMIFRLGLSLFEPGFFIGSIQRQDLSKKTVALLSSYQRILLGASAFVLLLFFIYEGSYYKANIWIVFLSFVVFSIQGLFALYPAKLTTRLRQAALAKAQMISYSFEFIFLLVAMRWMHPVLLFATALVLRLLVYYVLCLLYSKDIVILSSNDETEEEENVIKYSTGYVINQGLSYFQGVYDNIFIGLTFGLSILGPYNLACELSYIFFSKINPIFNRAIFPVLSKHRDKEIERGHIIKESFLSFLIVMVPLYLLTWFNLDWLMSMAYHTSATGILYYAKWVFLIALIKAINNILFSYILALGNASFILRWNIFIIFFNYSFFIIAYWLRLDIELFLQLNILISAISMLVLLIKVNSEFKSGYSLLKLLNRFLIFVAILIICLMAIMKIIDDKMLKLLVSSLLTIILVYGLFPQRVKKLLQFKIIS